MSKPKVVEITKNGFRTVWRNSQSFISMVDVEVFVEGAEKPLIEWSYGKIRNGIQKNAELWLDQAILEARGELRNLAVVVQ